MNGNLTNLFGPKGFDANDIKEDSAQPAILRFHDALQAFGLLVDDPIITGQIVRTKTQDQPHKRNGWYLYFGDDASSGIAAGVYGDWRHDGDRNYWCSIDSNDMTPQQRKSYDRAIALAKQKADEERTKKQEEVAHEIASQLDSLPLCAAHEYLSRKQVKPYGLYQDGDSLIVPARDVDGKVWTIQRILTNGGKFFAAGGRIKGCFHLIGSALTNPTYVAEGYATAATIHAITGKSVVVAFNTGNLAPVIAALREKGNQHQIIIAADNDRNTQGNPGIKAAEDAASQFVGVQVVVPQFQGSEGTDFNDLCAAEGVGAVMAALSMDEEPGKPLLLSPSQLQVSAPSWIIKGIIPTDGIGVLFGPSGGGKSFAVLDMCLSIAAGIDWHGRKTKRQGPVIYVCGEGQQGVANRLRAWEKFTGTAIDDLPIRITRIPVRFLNPGEPSMLQQAIEDEAGSIGRPELIAIDTLNRNFGDGDENSTKDMTAFIDSVTDLQKHIGCTVLIVHHTGLADGDRARGNGSLRNACDFEIQHGIVSDQATQLKKFYLRGKKMKDGSEMPDTYFQLEFVPLGVDEDGDEFGSCAVTLVAGDAVEGASIAKKIMSGNSKNIRAAFAELQRMARSIVANKPGIDQILINEDDFCNVLRSVTEVRQRHPKIRASLVGSVLEEHPHAPHKYLIFKKEFLDVTL